MKRFVSFFLILCALNLSFCVNVFAFSPHDITAEAAVLIDAETGQVLFDKNMRAKRHPASITKIMTGLLTVENCDTAEVVTVSDTAVDILFGSSHIALTPGEQLPVDSAMYALMLPSANDAANALAEHISGSQLEFARLMTQRAHELGAVDTNFTNAHGLPDDRHLTTAYDMAMITREAIQHPDFLQYYGAQRHTIPATNLQEEERPFTNQQFMLLEEMWVYNPYVIGGKVGYTQEARHTMSSAASKNGRTLIAVTLGCGIDEKFYDTQALFDYGFDNFKQVTVPLPVDELKRSSIPVMEDGDEVGEALVKLEEEAVTLLIPENTNAEDIRIDYTLPDALEAGELPELFLTLSLTKNLRPGTPAQLLQVPLTLDVPDSPEPDVVEAMADFQRTSIWSKLGKIVLTVAVASLVLMVALYLHIRRSKVRAAAKRRKRRLLREQQQRMG